MIIHFYKRIFTWFLIFQYTFLSVVQATGDQWIFELKDASYNLGHEKNQYTLHVRKKEKDGVIRDILKSRIQRDGSVVRALDVPTNGSVQITTLHQNKRVHIQYISDNIKEKLGFDITSEGNFTLTSMKGKGNFHFSTFGLLTLDAKTLQSTSLSLTGKRIRNNSHLTVDNLTLQAIDDNQNDASILNTVSGVINVKTQMNVLKGNIHNEGGIRTQEKTIIDLHNNNLINQDCQAPVKGIESTGKLEILNVGILENSTSLNAQDLIIKGQTLTNTAEINADRLIIKTKYLQNQHLIEGKSFLKLLGKELSNNGSLIGGKKTKISHFKHIDNQGTIRLGTKSNFHHLGDFINDGTIDSKEGALKIDGQNLTTYGLIEAKTATLSINHTFFAHEIIRIHDLLDITAARFINKTTLLGGEIRLTTQTRFENDKAILAKNKLIMNLIGTSLNNGFLSEEGDIAIMTHGAFINKNDITPQQNLVIDGTGSFDNQADLKATTICIRGFDHLLNQGIIWGANHYDLSFMREFINEGFIQGNQGNITSENGVMINHSEIRQATMAIKSLQNQTTGLIKKANITVSVGWNEGIIKADDFTVNDALGFYNRGNMFLQKLLGTGYFHNLSVLDFIQKNQTPSVIAIHSFLNQAQSISKQPAMMTGSIVEITSHVHSFVTGNKGGFFVQDLILNDGKGIYKNEGEFNADFFTLNQNTFTNSGQMDVTQFKGDKGTLVNHGILFALEKASFSQFENRGTAVLEELDISEHGGNQGTLTLKALSGSGTFINRHLLTLNGLKQQSDQGMIGIARFINETSNADFIAKVRFEIITY